jgi:hypothetical protein
LAEGGHALEHVPDLVRHSRPIRCAGPVAVPVAFDVNVQVSAGAGGNSPFRPWPSSAHTSGNPAADSLGLIMDAAKFALRLSPRILDRRARCSATCCARTPSGRRPSPRWSPNQRSIPAAA